MASLSRTPKKSAARIVLGMSGFEKISAIEGVRLKPASKRMFADFEQRGLTHEQRRSEIARKHARKA